jgi:hypothetical protein
MFKIILGEMWKKEKEVSNYFIIPQGGKFCLIEKRSMELSWKSSEEEYISLIYCFK